MRHRFVFPSVLLVFGALSLAACGNDTTSEPTAPVDLAVAVAANSWITRAAMPSNRTNLTAATVTNATGQSTVYAIGGLNPNGVPVDKVTAYDVATNTWTFRRRLPWPLAESNGAGVINGKIYLTGGYSDGQGAFPSNRLLVYDPATNTWTGKHDMPRIGDQKWVGAGGVTGVINGKLYVVTPCFAENAPWGYDEGCSETGPQLFRYNPATDRWATLPGPFNSKVSTFVRSPYAGGVISGKLYVMAGSFYTQDARFAVYDPATNKWTELPLALKRPRPGAATAVLDDKLYLMGGLRWNDALETYETLALTIVYNPATNAWTQRAPMPIARAGIAGATVLLGGRPRIEVVGGNVPNNNLQYTP